MKSAQCTGDRRESDGSTNTRERKRGESTSRSENTRLTSEEIFTVLSNERRRDVIRHLRDIDGETTVGTLAELIAAEENDITVGELSSYQRKCVYVSLYQNHLPLMDDINVVDYDDGRKTVEIRETVADLEPYLEETDDPFRHPFLSGVTAGSAILVFLGALQIGVFGILPVSLWTVLGLAVLISMAVGDVCVIRDDVLPDSVNEHCSLI